MLKIERRGRPKSNKPTGSNLNHDIIPGGDTPIKFTRKIMDEDQKGYSVWNYDLEKFKNGPMSVENFNRTDSKKKIEIIKNQRYTPQPVVMVFKSSNRSNANVKMKVWSNTNIDYIISLEDIPGVPAKAEILELAVGSKFVEQFKEKYNIK